MSMSGHIRPITHMSTMLIMPLCSVHCLVGRAYKLVVVSDKLIEILLTRGQRGYEQFLEILEYQYPHVFQEVTNKEPRDPPPGNSIYIIHPIKCTY